MAGSNFNPKIIQEKCQKAGISYWTTTEVIMAIKDKIQPGMAEDEIDDLVIEELKKIDENAARLYENFHRIYVRTSDGELEPFNKEKIVESLLKETTLPQSVCEEIANEVESDIRRLELRYISAALVRDIVNSKLLERRYIRVRQEYSRIGLPLYDVNQMIENPKVVPRNPEAIHKQFGDAITREYTLVKILPEDIAKAHLSGFIHIHDLPYFPMRITSLQNDLRWFLKYGLYIDENTTVAGPPKHSDTAFSQATRILISGSTHISGGQGFDFFNLFIAPFTINLNDDELKQIVQGFIYEINQLQGVNGGRVPLATLNFEIEAPNFIKREKAILPNGITSTDTYLDYEREAVRVLNTFLDVMSNGDHLGRPFKVPRIVIKIRDGPIPEPTLEKLDLFLSEGNSVILVNHRGRNIPNIGVVAPNHMLVGKKKNWFETIRTGILQEVSINLPYIGLKSRDEVTFFSMLEEALNYTKEVVSIKKKIVENAMENSKILPFLSQEKNEERYFQLEYAPGIINLVGLDSAISAFKGKEIMKDEEAFLFAEKVISFVKNKLENFVENEGVYIELANLETINVRERFSTLNLKNFGVKDVYYNTFVNENADLIGWMKVENKLQSASLGGNYFRVSLSQFARSIKKEYNIKHLYSVLDYAPTTFILEK